MNELALFAGVGGGILGTKYLLGWRTVCYVEWDQYAVEVLKARIRDGYLDDAPIWDDANTFDGAPWAGLVDVVSAGFPCQPFSTAGKGLAENDPRNGWPATIRIIRQIRPRVAWLENVPGLLSKPYFGTILGELAEAGYRVKWDCVSAQEVGAPHIRERLWIVAYSKSGARDIPIRVGNQEEELHTGGIGAFQPLAAEGTNSPNTNSHEYQSGSSAKQRARPEVLPANSDRQGLVVGKSKRGNNGKERPTALRSGWWATEPRLGRVANGVADRVDRLAATGNGQVPAVVEEAWRRLTDPKP